MVSPGTHDGDSQRPISRQALQPLLQRSNTRAVSILLGNWALVVGPMALLAWQPSPLTFVLALVLVAGRQLGLAILMHECAHGVFFESRAQNRNLGRWLCAAPILTDLDAYRAYHLEHHRKAGTDGDPDYPNYRYFPVSRASLRRKITRDLLGITGIKNLYGVILMYGGVLDYDLSYKPKDRHRVSAAQFVRNLLGNLYRPLVLHGIAMALLALSDLLWLYGVWWLAFLTLFSVFSRLRNAAEHGAVPDLLDADPRKHTRTVLPRWWERLTVAPNFVNFHLEHHLLPSVPCYRLAALHRKLADSGYLENVRVPDGYAAVIRELVNGQASPAH
ncbi:fatty acid desaturase family protein [Biformimicrobium ophioploci]|uniref:Fatty acid desaturase family protein n=1 Tax=Biformimicrobium ophioploci TaxID=3036711 RepID=A0ABQ6LWJ7_9GAMM|nr:fatty acid desaturase family protein [Microbulbifer sp. NKW57]GMG86475.1 fatty acid desaturase family protein [Microbulbifer sp. NKW57]